MRPPCARTEGIPPAPRARPASSAGLATLPRRHKGVADPHTPVGNRHEASRARGLSWYPALCVDSSTLSGYARARTSRRPFSVRVA